MAVTISDPLVMVKPEWPHVVCDSPSGVHRFYLELGAWWLCRWCEAEIKVGDWEKVTDSWDWVIERAVHTEKMRMN